MGGLSSASFGDVQRLWVLALLCACGGRPSFLSEEQDAIQEVFAGSIDLNAPLQYADQPVPSYITRENGTENPITDLGATLGRVLFYDTELSVDRTVSCASCHQQAFAFSDPDTQSEGVDGVTGRHSMRLINARFGGETSFFWDERAESLEIQSTMPIQDHVEMGFSGENGDPGFADLVTRLGELEYYTELFGAVFGSEYITENRMRHALAQFVRSIQSFDSRYDAARSQVIEDIGPFLDFTALENEGKRLFMQECATCHRPPEFDIDPGSQNNGVITSLSDPEGFDTEVTRSPTLRDMVGPDGASNGPFMHDGAFETIRDVLDHYDSLPDDPNNDNLDFRLDNPPSLLAEDKDALEAFLKTLSGSAVYTDERWSDPFPD